MSNKNPGNRNPAGRNQCGKSTSHRKPSTRHPAPQRKVSPLPPPQRSPRPNKGLLGGCGIIVVIAALLTIIALVGFLVSGWANRPAPEQERVPIPADVPPAAAQPAPDINIHGDGRTALLLMDWARPISEATGIPLQAVMAYGNAEVIARQSRPECGMTWNTLAGLGYVETMHGTYDGKKHGAASLNDEGFVDPEIFGPQLNGGQFAVVKDTDKGEMDGDPDFDRAMGPLQFIPESWGRYGVDANGDGENSPQNIDDAAASAVRLLCDHERDLKTPEGWTQAISSYNMSQEYVLNVRDAAAHYALNQPPEGY